MPLDAISEERLAQGHPVLSARVHGIANALVAEGYIPRVTRCLASIPEQDALWQQGRDANGNVIGPIVTNAKGTQSNHVMGFAADFCFMTPAGEVDWKSPGFGRLPELAPSYGLRSGAHWGDRPHVELAEFPVEPTPEMQAAYLEGGVTELWAEFLPVTS